MRKYRFSLIGVALLSLVLAACTGSNTENNLPNASVTANSSVTTVAPGSSTTAATGTNGATGATTTTNSATTAAGATTSASGTAATTGGATTSATGATTTATGTTAGTTASGNTSTQASAFSIPPYPNATGIALGSNLQQQVIQAVAPDITNPTFQAFTAGDEPGRILGFYNNQLTGGQALLTPIPGTNDQQGNAPGGPNVTPSPNAAGAVGKSGNLSFLAGLDGQIVNFVCPSGSGTAAGNGSAFNATPGSSSNSNTGANSLATGSNSAANGTIRDCTQAGSTILSGSTPGNATNWSTTAAAANGNATVPAAPSPTPLTGPVTALRILALGPLDDNSLSRLTGLSPELSRSVRKGDTLVMIVAGTQNK